MTARLLGRAADEQLAEARRLVADLRDGLIRFGATSEDEATLARSIRQLDELFLLVVVGEFNAGKSAFINALVGQTVVPEGVTPTTARIQLVEYGDRLAQQVDPDGMLVITAPADFLADLHIVDTPGTNAVVREHERLTAEFVPRADLVLFVTSADRPFTETERAFLEVIRDWGKKIVVVVNKIDILRNDAELNEIVRFVGDSARQLLGISPEIFPVSARLAERAKHGEPQYWAPSQFEALARFIREALDPANRFRLKVSNPLGVAQALAARYATLAGERLSLLARDVALLDDLGRQLAVYRDDLERGLEVRMEGIEKVLVEMEARGHEYFEDTLRIGRIIDLLNRARVQKEFEDRVVADAPHEVERRVAELAEWLVEQDYRQWQAVTAQLKDRTAEHGARVPGGPEIGSFHADRARLIEAVGREAHRVVDSYNRRAEAQAIADQARVAVTTAAAVGAGALGLGTLVTIAATTAAADVTGILAAAVIAGIGFWIIPAKRRRAKLEMQQKLGDLRARLEKGLRDEFERAEARSTERIEEAIAPYSRFVRAEQARWADARQTLARLGDAAASLKERIAQAAVGKE